MSKILHFGLLLEIDPTHGADSLQDFVLNEAKVRLSDVTILERLLRASGRNKNKEINQSEHRKREKALKSLDMLNTKLNILPQESKAFTQNAVSLSIRWFTNLKKKR